MNRFSSILSVSLLLLAVGCAKQQTADGPDPDANPADVLAEAKAAILETSGVTLDLGTESLPDGVSGLVRATGTLTPAPAFDGNITVRFGGFDGDVDVRAVDGKVYAVLPFTSKFTSIDPGDYGAPDPASLIDPDSGIPAWLSEATDLEAGEAIRDGSEILQSYTGSLDAELVDKSIPSAAGEGTFEATFTIDSLGLLRNAEVTGEFYEGKPELTYVVTFEEYGTDADISAPE